MADDQELPFDAEGLIVRSFRKEYVEAVVAGYLHILSHCLEGQEWVRPRTDRRGVMP